MKESNFYDMRTRRAINPWRDPMYKSKDGGDYFTFEALKAANDAFFASLKLPDRKLVAPKIIKNFPRGFPIIRE